MENDELRNEINNWKQLLQNNGNNQLIELAFFKIFIKFEKFISQIFVDYSVGKQSSSGYIPERKLLFSDETHLNYFLKKENKAFINHYQIALELSAHIFIVNPFEILTTDANFSSEVLRMKFLRDYIAHESQHSEQNYKAKVLSNHHDMKPYEFLHKVRNNTNMTNYSFFIKLMIDSSEYLIKGPL
jgi:hypothetical protein